MKTQEYLNLNHRLVHENINQWRIISHKLGKSVLVDAECIFGQDKGKIINLISSRSNQAKAIRQSIGMNLIS